MKPILTSDLKVKFLGITPVFEDKTGVLNPQEIIALSSLATFKGKSIKKLLKEITKSGQSVDERIKGILQRSVLRGHASIATTPAICLIYEGSKFLDSALTGIVFSSSLVSSGRRTKTTEEDIVFPREIFNNKKTKNLYSQTSKNIIQIYNYFLTEGVPKDEASKILQYGIYGTGIIHLPIESIIGLKKEYFAEKEWMPEEIGILLKKIKGEAKKLGVDLLYAAREAAPRNIYPYPNIFKDPQKSNLTRELRKSERLIKRLKLISIEGITSKELKKKLENLGRKEKEIFSSFRRIKKEWTGLLSLLQEILRDYNLALRIKILSSIPWRVWGEKKRHRTCFQIIESIYYCIERAGKKFSKFKNQIRGRKINKKLVREIEEIFSIPPSIKNNQEFLSEYLLTALNAFEGYQKLIESGIKPREAIFLIPRATKIDILQEYDLYNLLTGYYPLRLCPTAEEEMRRNTLKEVVSIKKALVKRGYGWLNNFIGPKCQITGFCPEEKSCPMILSSVKNYNEKFHQEMKEELKRLFQENLKN
ncbi:MAG: FAD-dependent thymidylate synthase, partial [Candidatus Nealsonbacteria bacterium]|nr:FAD-dependent thymidylate synthase [Candidatus Nealsonbacteria bacterium]